MERFRPAAILLYGSYGSGRQGASSDVDLALLINGPLPDAIDQAQARVELERLLGRPVDLAILDTASPVLAMEVLRQHRVLAIRDPQALEDYVVKVLGAYFDLKIVRRPIEQALLSTRSR